MKLYIIRHGETVWNTQRRLQGWLNSDLTDRGRKAARNLRNRFDEENINFDYAYTSNQDRAKDTAEIILDGKDTEIIEIENLKEIGFGPWEGMVIEDINKKYNNGFDDYVEKAHLYEPIDGGETFEEVFERVDSAFKEIIENGGDNILIVSHGVILKVLTAIIKDIPLEEFYTLPIHEGTALNICEVKNGKMEFILEGDTRHIRR